MKSGKSGSPTKVFNSLDAVEDRLVEALVALENDRELVASTTGFDWVINRLSDTCPCEVLEPGERTQNNYDHGGGGQGLTCPLTFV